MTSYSSGASPTDCEASESTIIIQTSDIDDIVALVDEHRAPLVCSLLVAYGYARSPRKADSTETDESDTPKT